jgi:hypothetical protein
MRASLKPLGVAAASATIIAVIPVTLTALLAARSNRPEIGYAAATAGSLHPVHFLQFGIADLFGAMRPNPAYWAPKSDLWDAAWGSPGLNLSQNMGLVYAGALTVAVVVSLGLVRGLAFAREIRVFTIAAACLALYSLGGYTPLFHMAYDVLPGIDLFRRPADATFVLAALIALIAGYLVHRRITGSAPAPTPAKRSIEFGLPVVVVLAALLLAQSVVGASAALTPIATALVFTAAAVLVLVVACRLNAHAPLAATGLVAALMVVDLAWNNAPHMSTGLPPQQFDALITGTHSETVRVIEARLAAATAPDRRDRVELIGIGYHWPNLPLAQGFDHVFGHNPLRLRAFHEATRVGDTVAVPSQRVFSPLYPSYRSSFADLLGVRFIATGVPVEQIDSSIRPGDLKFIAHTGEAYIYENPRALPRVMVLADWRVADFDEIIRTGWPNVDPRRTVLLEHAPARSAPAAAAGAGQGAARFLRYGNTEVIIEADAPAGGILLLTDVWSPWWRAQIDGVETEVLKADVLFRAVAVTPGRHVVRFTFHPLAGAIAELQALLVAHR